MALRAPLSRDRILRAAVDLADASGVEALTMRRLADELGFEAMSLYRHVANKQDLLDGMLDLMLAEWELPEGEWEASLRTSAHSVHDALLRHRWAAQLLITGSHLRPARLRYMEFLLGRLRAAGVDADTTFHLYHLLDGYIFGMSMWEIAYTSMPVDADTVQRVMSSIPWDEYPNLAEHRDLHMTEGAHREVSAFSVGLELILDGLRTRLSA